MVARKQPVDFSPVIPAEAITGRLYRQGNGIFIVIGYGPFPAQGGASPTGGDEVSINSIFRQITAA